MQTRLHVKRTARKGVTKKAPLGDIFDKRPLRVTKRDLPVIKKRVFDFNIETRERAAGLLSYYIGWKSTIEFIRTHFQSAGGVPIAFFYSVDVVSGSKKIRKWRDCDWNAIKKQVIINYKKLPIRREYLLERMKDEKGKPFSVMGIPVFLAALEGGLFGKFKDGFLIVEKHTEKLPLEFRPSIAWHEFGEAFSDSVGACI